MKIVLPEHIGEITLDKFQRYHKLSLRKDLTQLDFDKRKIEIFTGIPFQKVGNVMKSDYEYIINQIDKSLETNHPFVNRFTLNGIEFGFIPNFDDITTNEDVDLKSYADKEEDLHKVMAILFRPIINKDSFDNYDIESYNGTGKYAKVMKQMPMNIVSGALGFFLTLSKELRKHIQKFTTEEQMKEVVH